MAQESASVHDAQSLAQRDIRISVTMPAHSPALLRVTAARDAARERFGELEIVFDDLDATGGFVDLLAAGEAAKRLLDAAQTLADEVEYLHPVVSGP